MPITLIHEEEPMGTDSLDARLDEAEAALGAKLIESGMKEAAAPEVARANRGRILLSLDGVIRVHDLRGYAGVSDHIGQLAKELVIGAPADQLADRGLGAMSDEEQRALLDSKRKSGAY